MHATGSIDLAGRTPPQLQRTPQHSDILEVVGCNGRCAQLLERMPAQLLERMPM